MAEEKQKRKFGGPQPGSGRPSKAQEFGLAALMDEAWPHEKRVEAIKHLALLVTTAKQERVQVAAAELLLDRVYGKPKAVDIALDFDLSADIDKMTPDELDRYRLKIQRYALAKGIQL